MKVIHISALTALIFTLSACGGAGKEGTTKASQIAWTDVELSQILDTQELGKIENDGAGNWTANGRSIDYYDLQELAHKVDHGRDFNLLRLDKEVYAEMSPEATDLLMNATPDEVRAILQTYGLTVTSVREIAGFKDSEDLYSLKDITALASTMNTSNSSEFLQIQSQSGMAAGDLLLRDLGLEGQE